VRIVSTLVMLAVCSLCWKAEAQQPKQGPKLGPYVAPVVADANSRVVEVRSRFVQVAPPKEAAVIRAVKITVENRNWDIYGTYSAPGRITIPIGFLLAADYMDRAVVESGLRGHEQAINDYAKYLGSKLTESDSAVRNNSAPPPIQYFCEWVGNSEAQCNGDRASKRYKTLFDSIKWTSIGFVIAHELGHHINGDLQSSGAAYDVESAADAYGIRLLLKADLNPLLTLGTFLMFDSFVKKDVPQRSLIEMGPSAECRGLRAMRAGVQYIESIKAKRPPMFAQFKAALDQAKKQDPLC
jgi:hypothetical protein